MTVQIIVRVIVYTCIQVKDMPPENIEPYSSNGAPGVIGHYSQVVWAESYAVGCGYVYFFDGQWYKKVGRMHIYVPNLA